MYLSSSFRNKAVLAVLLAALFGVAGWMDRTVLYYKVGTHPIDGCIRVDGLDPKNGMPIHGCEKLNTLQKTLAKKVAVEK